MIRLVTFMRRHPRLELSEFHDSLRKDYGPLVASVQTPLGIRRHTQTHRLAEVPAHVGGDPRGELQDPYDAVAETWWESLEALTEAWASERGKQANVALMAAEAELVDLPESPLFLAYEHPQFSDSLDHLVARPNGPLVKVHYAIRHIADMTFDQAQHHWRTVHGPFIRTVASALNMHRYQQIHRYDAPLEAELRASRGVTVEPYLGYAEVWRHQSAIVADDRIQRLVVEDEGRFIDFSRSMRTIGKEHVFVDTF